ncbi:MAG: hypothetical protein JSW67_00955 [Candidatus Latescibacterota bacterium]|nr:MAG: hypothetical protein JSW67_00955 [Candidatus Latescibacterota bacterium]
MTGLKSDDRAGGLHPVYGRHYKHLDVSSSASRTRLMRHRSYLLLVALDAMLQRYEQTMDHDELESLHDVVLQRLRPQLQDDWTEDVAAERGLEIATEVLQKRTPRR